MFRRFVLMMAVCTCVPTLASALTIPPPPPSMCTLNESISEQAAMLNYLRAANAGSNSVLTAFADCNELASIASKKSGSVTRYGVVLSQSLGEPISLTRQDYIAAVASVYNQSGAGLTETALTMSREAVDKASTTEIYSPKSMTADQQGILFRDENMVIIGIHQANNFGTRTANVASTAGLTLVGGTPVSVNIYAPSASDAFSHSVALLKPFLAQLLASNR